MSFDNLKKSSSIDKLLKAVEESSKVKTTTVGEDRFWRTEVDKAGNGYAVIRFLSGPAVDADEDGYALPWAQYWSHSFKGPGGWYIENCLTTLNRPDPVVEHNNVLWNTGEKDKIALAQERKRKLNFVSNVLVVTDPKHPENEGKVFLFKYGKKIKDKIDEKMKPKFPDEKPMNVFDFWKGANFKLKIAKEKGYTNYDRSEFESPTALYDGDNVKIEKLWRSLYSLKEFTDAKNFKSYEDLKARFDRVTGGGAAASVSRQVDEDSVPFDTPASVPAPTPKRQAGAAESVAFDDDDDLSYFEKLAAE